MSEEDLIIKYREDEKVKRIEQQQNNKIKEARLKVINRINKWIEDDTRISITLPVTPICNKDFYTSLIYKLDGQGGYECSFMGNFFQIKVRHQVKTVSPKKTSTELCSEGTAPKSTDLVCAEGEATKSLDFVYVLKENTRSCPREDILGVFTTNKLAEEAVRKRIEEIIKDDPGDDKHFYEYRNSKGVQSSEKNRLFSSPDDSQEETEMELYAVYSVYSQNMLKDDEGLISPKKYFEKLDNICYASINVVKVPLNQLDNFY